MTLRDILKVRADFYRKIRLFFDERNVLEVETPLLCSHTVTDPYMKAFRVGNRFLQTSPEYAMKRLLASGSGSIFQLCKAFRDEENGSHHNPEFTMLEWYREHFNHHDLMTELDLLMQTLLDTPEAKRQSYQHCFLEHVGIDPFKDDIGKLHAFIQKNDLLQNLDGIDHDTALQVILNRCIEPHLGQTKPFFLYDFPPKQASLSKIRHDVFPVGERFELYYQGLELANGFHELLDANEQDMRFKEDQQQRLKQGLYVPDIDYYFIDALKKGMPAVSGVAVGIDRLILIACGAKTLEDILPFSWGRC